MKINRYNQKGYIALITVIIVLTVGIIIGVTASLNAVNEMQLGFSSAQSEQALIIADSCMEEAIIRLKRSETPPTNLSFAVGSCTIDVQDLGGDDRRVKVTGTVSDYNRLIESELNVGAFAVTSWQEVGEFTP